MKHMLTLAVAALLAASGLARAENICADATKIYYGDPEGEKPATVKAADCFDAIPEWQEIERRKLTQSDADYWILLRAANARFRKAVEAVARAKGYDLVAEQGTVKAAPDKTPPDATKAVMDQIKSTAEDKQ
ncbi:MAG: hypothetical protein K8T20_07300 [Planctomycetes bacterium]|nr:hypothetical protein [Planctomycetota bacterium]